MSIRTIALLSATAVSLATGSLAAQTTSASSAAKDPWSGSPAGNYDLFIVSAHDRVPAALTIVQKYGKLEATITPADDGQAHLMNVRIDGTDLILSAANPEANVTMTLQHHGADIFGTWRVRKATGTIEGTEKLSADAGRKSDKS